MLHHRLLPVFILLLCSACAGRQVAMNTESPYFDLSRLEKGEILHLETGHLLVEEELYDYLEHFRVVYVGESHDSVDDHAVQLRILQELHDRFPGQVALGMEMLRRPYQEEVDAFVAGEMAEKEFLRVWQKNWGPRSFPYYRDILAFARENRIPILALNAGNDLRDAIRDNGIGGLDREMQERLPEMGSDDPYYRAFMEGMFGGHTKGSNQMDVFLDIQELWDETMAQTAAGYLRSPEGADKRLVVFAGGNHVRYGFGIPRRLFRRVPAPYVIVDPYTVEFPEEKKDKLMEVDLPALPLPPADVYWAVGYEDLEDQRVMLGVQIEDAEDGGVRVLGVIPGSPAAAAGLETGDVIVGVDGQAVQEMFDLTYQVGLHKPGDTGPVTVLRGEEEIVLQVEYDVIRHGE